MCFSLASKMVPACACVCGGRVMAYKVRLHLKNQKRCHPIGYGFERLDSKLGWGRFFFFFFSRRWREGLEGDYLWEAITLIFPSKGGEDDYSREAINRRTAIIRGNAPYVVDRLKLILEINRNHNLRADTLNLVYSYIHTICDTWAGYTAGYRNQSHRKNN